MAIYPVISTDTHVDVPFDELAAGRRKTFARRSRSSTSARKTSTPNRPARPSASNA